MGKLIAIRDEIICGDLRSLYIGWMSSMYFDEDQPDNTLAAQTEPQCVPGLGQLSPAQLALADFIDCDADYLTAAAMDAPELTNNHTDEQTINRWLTQLPSEEATPILLQLFNGSANTAKNQLKQLYTQWWQTQFKPKTFEPRSLWTIFQHIEPARHYRAQQMETARQALSVQERQARIDYLSQFFLDKSNHWDHANREANKQSGYGYDAATTTLCDLRDAYGHQDKSSAFNSEFGLFIRLHLKRPALLTRLRQHGFNV